MLNTSFKISGILILALLFNQCSKPVDVIQFELLNKELYFSPIFSSKKGGVEFLYEDYISNGDKNKSQNTLRYKLTNNLPYKILFIPNSDELTYIHTKKDDGFQSLLGYSILDSSKQDIERLFSPSIPKDEAVYLKYIKKDSLEFVNDSIEYRSIYDRKMFKDFTFLEPNETVTYEFNFNLPIVKESNNPAILGPDVHPLYLENEYYFQLHYVQNRIQLEKELPRKIFKYLRDNNIEIVDLSFHSEIIKLKPKL